MSDTIEKTKEVNPLTNKTVRVVPIVRPGSTLHGAGHDGEFLFTGCRQGFMLPVDVKKGQLKQILNEDERKFFEKTLHLKDGDLSIYKKKENFWHRFVVYLTKDTETLNLSDPIDNLRYRVLKVCSQIAPSWEERYNSPTYKFALVDSNYEVEERVKVSDKRKKAYKWLGAVEDSWDKMYDFLRVYGKRPSKNAKKDFLIGEIDKLIEDPETLTEVLSIIEDPNYEIQVFIEDAILAGSIVKIGKTGYSLQGGDKIGSTLSDAIEYLKNPLNQDVFIKIKSQIENSK